MPFSLYGDSLMVRRGSRMVATSSCWRAGVKWRLRCGIMHQQPHPGAAPAKAATPKQHRNCRLQNNNQTAVLRCLAFTLLRLLLFPLLQLSVCGRMAQHLL